MGWSKQLELDKREEMRQQKRKEWMIKQEMMRKHEERKFKMIEEYERKRAEQLNVNMPKSPQLGSSLQQQTVSVKEKGLEK